MASWAASPHGPYPSGNPSAQPDLSAVFETAADGAIDQTFRLIVKPDLWGKAARIRLSNVFGARPVTFDDVFVGLQSSGGNVASGTNRQVRFERGRTSVTIAAGASVASDAIVLDFVKSPSDPLLAGRKLVVSFHVVGSSGPMTWHAKALTTSYVTAPRAGSHGREDSDAAFPFTTTSWYFLDAVDVVAAEDVVVVACFGDSITDGTASTLNGDDRWPDVLSRRLHEKFGARVSVVNAGIGGNRVVSPVRYSAATPVAGGPSALERFDRDVADLSGVSAVIWLEGINDLSGGAKAEAVIAGMREIVSAQPRPRPEDLRRDDRVEPRQRHGTWHARGRCRASGHQRVHPQPPGHSMASSTSIWRRAIRRPAACARRSSPTARPVDLAIDCTRTGPAIWRWATPLTSACSRRSSAGDESRRRTTLFPVVRSSNDPVVRFPTAWRGVRSRRHADR